MSADLEERVRQAEEREAGAVEQLKRLWARVAELEALSPVAAEPPPTAGEGPPIVELVIADLRLKSTLGERKYGRPLRAHDGRSGLRDLYQELLDATQYLRKVISEEGG